MKKLKMFVLTLWALVTPTLAMAEPLSPLPREPRIIDTLKFDTSRTAVLKSDVNNASADAVIKTLVRLDMENQRKITLIIQTNGGIVEDGYRIIGAMKSLRSPLQCIVDHHAYSMGAIIAAYCPTLYMTMFSKIMFHNAFCLGETGLQEPCSENIQHQMQEENEDLARVMGISLDELMNRKSKEWWMTATEAVRAGFATAMVRHI